MKETPKTSVDDLLVSLSTTYEESINRVTAVTSEEELGTGDDKTEEAETTEPTIEMTSTKKEKIQKKKVHVLMGEDPWKLGREKLSDKNILQVRAEKARQSQEKSKIRECILSDIETLGAATPVDKLNHVNRMPPWQRGLRSVNNSLGLTM